MNRIKWLLFVAGCLAVTGLAYWKNLPDAPTPVKPLELTAAATPAATNEAAPVLPSRDMAAVAPLKETASPTATATATATSKPAPARAKRNDVPATVTAERRESARPASTPEVTKAPARATTYEQRVASAAAGDDSDRALTELQRLAAGDPNRPEAYEAMAAISLKKKDYTQARDQIAFALAHGGKASFSIIHDHSRGNFDASDTKSTCVGELTIAADEVRFEAPGEGDRFAANWADVRDAGGNKFFGSGIGGFHVTITTGGKYKNVNLAPESKDKAEGKLILDLLNANTRKRDRTK